MNRGGKKWPQTDDETRLQEKLTGLFEDTAVPEDEARQEVADAIKLFDKRKAKLIRDIESQRRAEEAPAPKPTQPLLSPVKISWLTSDVARDVQ